MPFERPTLAELRTRVAQDVEAELDRGPLLPRSAGIAHANAQALQAHGAYGTMQRIAIDANPFTATGEGAEQWAASLGISKHQAQPAVGPVVATGANGSSITVGTELRGPAGQLYRATEAATITGGAATFDVEAVEGGLAGNLPEGAALTFTTPPAGVAINAVVGTGGLIEGTDVETTEALKTRYLERLANPPAGGNLANYLFWMRSVPGVTRAWAFREYFGAGTVGGTFVLDADPVSIAPTPEFVAGVQAIFDELAPATARATAFAPTLVPLNPTIQVTPNTADVRAEVEAALKDLLRREAQPGGTMPRSAIAEAIATAPGEVSHALLSPAADVTVAAHELLVLGEITWA